MNLKEFNRRCNEVFISKEGDYYSSIHVIGGRVIIEMEEENDDGDLIAFDYEPDMTERPEALDYLLGKRDDFND